MNLLQLVLFLPFIAYSQSRSQNYLQAIEYKKSGKLKLAKNTVQQNLRKKPLHRPSLELLADIFKIEKNYPKSIRAYKILIKKFYDQDILKIKDISSLKNEIDYRIGIGKIPDQKTLSYFQNIQKIFEQVAKCEHCLKKEEISKNLKIDAQRYEYIYDRFNGVERSIHDSRSNLETKARVLIENKDYDKAIDVYSELIENYFDSKVLYIQEKDLLLEYLNLRYSKNLKIGPRTIQYFKNLGRIYHTLLRKNEQILPKVKLEKLMWLRDKYILCYNAHIYPQKYLKTGKSI